MKFRLPTGWTVWWHSPRWWKPFGRYDKSNSLIEIWPVAWIPKFLGRDKFAEITRSHEALHAWGNPGCRKPWCLGFEGYMLFEFLFMPIQLLRGLKFCDKCKGYYREE
jgi:hypothetical protein